MSELTITDTTPDLTLDLTGTIDAHLAAYCDPDAGTRAATIARIWAPDGALVDPPLEGAGHEVLSALTDAVLTHYPSHTFRRTSAVDAHHRFARYTWELVAPDGTVAVLGTDVVETDADGRLLRIIGFFGELGPA